MFRIGLGAFLVLGLLFSACGSDSEHHELHCDEVWIMLGLDRKDQALADYVDQVSFPGSELYGQYLAMAEIAHRFGAASEVIQEVSSYLETWGMKDIHMGPTGGVINCKGCTEIVKTLFCYDPKAVTPSFCIPPALQNWVQEVLVMKPDAGATAQTLPSGSIVSTAAAGDRSGTPEGCQAGVDSGGFTPNQWLTAYGIDKLHERGLTGKGIRVAILNSNPWHEKAISEFCDCFSIPKPNAHLVAFPFEEAFSYAEAELDIEMIIAAAPDLERVTTFWGVTNVGPTVVLVHQAVLDTTLMEGTLPHVVSSSAGECEYGSFTADELALLEHFFMAGCAAGITYVEDSGDLGFTSDCETGKEGANYPTSSHYVTGVGGTQMVLTPENRIESETVWNDGDGSSGGGPSVIFERPSWQMGTGFEPFAGFGRLTPDVSFFASEDHPGYAIYGPPVFGPFDAPLGWLKGGGTSASAPLMAGIVALLNQQMIEAGKPPLGCINPLLYQLASDSTLYQELFRDITQGTSGGDTVKTGLAAPFYDLATGLGSLKADALGMYLKENSPFGKQALRNSF